MEGNRYPTPFGHPMDRRSPFHFQDFVRGRPVARYTTARFLFGENRPSRGGHIRLGGTRPGSIFKRFQPVGLFGVPYQCMRMAVVLRLLTVWVCVIVLGTTLTTSSQAEDLPDATDSFTVKPELIVPLGPVIYYIRPGPQPSTYAVPGMKVTLLYPGNHATGTTFSWFRDGQAVTGESSVQLDLGVVGFDDSAYYLATSQPPGGGSDQRGIQLIVADPASPSRLQNCSLRGVITNEVPRIIGGIVVAPRPNHLMLVRAIGPSLAAFGVPQPLPDPELHFFDAAGQSADGHILAVTATVEGALTIREQIERATQQVGAFPVSLDGDDVVYLVAFPPGVFTAHVTSHSGASGEVLLEFFGVPDTGFDSGRN